MDTKAFRRLSYGMYIIASGDSEGRAGCVVNTFAQVTGNPPRATVAVNKENTTADVIRRVGRYTASVLGEQAPMELIGRFGFRSSIDYDKFAETVYAIDSVGMPTVTDHAVACFEVQVTKTIDVGSHWLFIGDVVDARPLGTDTPMTYAYYHQVKGGKTPPKASSYIDEDAAAIPAGNAAVTATANADKPEAGIDTPTAGETSESTATTADGDNSNADAEPGTPEDTASSLDGAAPAPGKSTWRCMLCGYSLTIDGDELPADFTCPMCGAGREMFERVS